MRQIGKYGKKWFKVRREWVKLNLPNHQGYYECYICHIWIPANELTVDHIRSRSRNPELRYDIRNLAPACYECNNAKGSSVNVPKGKINKLPITDDIWD